MMTAGRVSAVESELVIVTFSALDRGYGFPWLSSTPIKRAGCGLPSDGMEDMAGVIVSLRGAVWAALTLYGSEAACRNIRISSITFNSLRYNLFVSMLLITLD